MNPLYPHLSESGNLAVERHRELLEDARRRRLIQHRVGTQIERPLRLRSRVGDWLIAFGEWLKAEKRDPVWG
jgi:hypothetical protein